MSRNGLTSVIEYPDQKSSSKLIGDLKILENEVIRQNPEEAAIQYVKFFWQQLLTQTQNSNVSTKKLESYINKFNDKFNQFISNLTKKIGDNSIITDDYLVTGKAARSAIKEPPNSICEENFEENFEENGSYFIKLNNKKIVKFRQKYSKIPVYGSTISVELNQKNKLVSLDSAIITPSEYPNLERIQNKISVDEISYYITKYYQKKSDYSSNIVEQIETWLTKLELNANLYYYYDSKKQKWRLVYITDLVTKQNFEYMQNIPLEAIVNYIIDAQNGEIVCELPVTKTTR